MVAMITLIDSPWFWAILLFGLAVIQTALMYFGMRALQLKREVSLSSNGRNTEGDLLLTIVKILKYWLVPSLILFPPIGYFVIAPIVSGNS
jgi:hypothetical protein